MYAIDVTEITKLVVSLLAFH